MRRGLTRPHLGYFKDFLTDTALFGGDHVPIDSDAPFASPGRAAAHPRHDRDHRGAIFHGNAERLLGLAAR